MDDGGCTDQSQCEEQCGGDVSHSFIPYFVHRTYLNRIGFLRRCFHNMFMLCSLVNA
jgi:hypothetical protein